MEKDWQKQRNQIIGLGENSFKKSYYPELQSKISELESSYQNLQTIFDTINDGIVIHDENARIILLNRQSQNIFNIKDSEKDKYTIFDITSNQLEKTHLIPIWEDVLNGNPRIINWIIKQAHTNMEIDVQVSINSTFWYGQKVLVAVVRDFSERAKFEKQLIEAKEKAEESDRLKTAFLQNISHEIRTPMNVIIGFSSLLGEDGLTVENRKKYSKIIQTNCNKLLSIVENILTVSSIEKKQEKVILQKACLNKIFFDLIELYKNQALRKNIAFVSQQHLSDSQSEIYTDKAKLIQIFIHLISNALKFTRQGFIEIGYEIKPNEVECYVKDSGIGVKPEVQDKIFENFRQADSSIQSKHGGSGLGLSISKGYIELLGGKIWVNSEVGKGTTFYFTIPYIKVSTTEDPSS